MGHSCKKIKNSVRKFCDFLNAKGVRGICPLQADFFQVPASGNWEKSEPVFPHRQCLLFFTEKVFAFSGIAEKIINFFRQYPHRGGITLATINIRNSGERG